MVTGMMLDGSESMTEFLGLAADSRLLEQDRFNLQAAEQSLKAPVPRHEHDRLIIAGSTLTAVSLVAGMVLLLYGGPLAPARPPPRREATHCRMAFLRTKRDEPGGRCGSLVR